MQIRIRAPVSALLLFVALPARAAVGSNAPAEVPAWIAAHAIRLESPAAGHGFADLQPLKRIIGDARIVALGEATHGTREFFQLKHRLLEFLATEMGRCSRWSTG